MGLLESEFKRIHAEVCREFNSTEVSLTASRFNAIETVRQEELDAFYCQRVSADMKSKL